MKNIFKIFKKPMAFVRNVEVSKIIYNEFTEEDYLGTDNYRLHSLQISDILTSLKGEILTVKITLGRPGLLIGKGGRTVDALRDKISMELYGELNRVKIDIIEQDLWFFHRYKN